jgi:hypothetical protein
VLVTIAPGLPRPGWLRAPAPGGENYRDLKSLIDRLQLHKRVAAHALKIRPDAGSR